MSIATRSRGTSTVRQGNGPSAGSAAIAAAQSRVFQRTVMCLRTSGSGDQRRWRDPGTTRIVRFPRVS